jgi:hypothetical protein
VRFRVAIKAPPTSEGFFLFCEVGWDWVHLVHRPLIGLLYQPWMTEEHGAFGGMRMGRGNRSTRRRPAPVPLCSPQMPHDLTWDRIRAAAVGSRRLTPWATSRPSQRDVRNDVKLETYLIWRKVSPERCVITWTLNVMSKSYRTFWFRHVGFFNIVTGTAIARQRLGKRVPAKKF